MDIVGLNVLLGADFSSAEEAMTRFYASVQSLAKNVQSVFSNMGGTASSVANMFKPISDGAQNASKIAINESKARQQADSEETQAVLNASKIRIQAIREEAAAQRAATVAKRAEKDLYSQFVADQNAVVREYYNAATALHLYGQESGFTAEKIAEMAEKARLGQEQLKSIEAGAGRFQRNVGNYSGATAYLQQSIAQLSGEIPNFFQSMRIGFMSIGNNIQPISMAIKGLRAENAKLLAQGKATQNILGAVTKSLFGWQTVLLVGVGIISRYGAQLIDWATGADKAKAKAEALKKQQEELNQIDQQATKSMGDQIGKLTALNSIVQDNTQASSKRKQAYDQLQKLYPSYLGNISQEQAQNGSLADVINTKLIPAIIASAKARAYQEKINKITSENIDLEDERAKAITKTAQAAAAYNKADRERSGNNLILGGNTAGAFQTNYAEKFAEDSKNAYSEAMSAQDDLTKRIGDNTNKIGDYIKQMGQAIQDSGKLGIDGIDPLTHKTNEVKEKVDALTKSGNNLSAEFENITARLNAGLLTTLDATKEKISAVSHYLDSLFKNGGTQEAIQQNIELLKQLNYQLSQMQSVDLNALKGLKGVSASDSFSKDFHEATKGNQDRAAAFGEDAFSKAGDPEKAIKRREKAAKDLNREFNHTYSILNRVVGGPLDSFTDAIFNGDNAMEALGNSIKDIVKNLAEAVIKAGIFSAIMSAINPTGFAAGGGFGGILGKLLPFATGGVVTGPTPALIGEAGPEAVIPLNKLGSIMGSRDVNVNVRGDIRGRNIKLANDRESAFKTR